MFSLRTASPCISRTKKEVHVCPSNMSFSFFNSANWSPYQILLWLEYCIWSPSWNIMCCQQATPLVAGLSVAAAAMGSRYMLQAWQAFRTRAAMPRVRRFYPGGFEREMTRREAALILGVRWVFFSILCTCRLYPVWCFLNLLLSLMIFSCFGVKECFATVFGTYRNHFLVSENVLHSIRSRRLTRG